MKLGLVQHEFQSRWVGIVRFTLNGKCRGRRGRTQKMTKTANATSAATTADFATTEALGENTLPAKYKGLQHQQW